MKTSPAANFDRIAKAYRWMEYASLGPVLERVRWWFLDKGRLSGCRRALVLGDGDGRFTARLLATNEQVRVTAVDLSGEMLSLLRRRCAGSAGRLSTVRMDARNYTPESPLDLIVTHFFLDCLTNDEVRGVVQRVRLAAGPGAFWLVSEFRIPAGVLRMPSRLFLRGLYGAFRVLTGLRVTRLPEYGRALRECGFVMRQTEFFLGGLLVTELWQVLT